MNNNPRLGACLSFQNSNLEHTIYEAESINANAIMIYYGSPVVFRKPIIDFSKVNRGLKIAEKNNIRPQDIVLHCNYISNFASPDENKRNMAMNLLGKEINFAKAVGIKYLVCHPGSYTTGDRFEGMQHVVECINTVLEEDDNVVICFETMAGKGKELGKTFEEIQYFVRKIKLQDKVGFCLDTCHAWDAGFDVTDIDGLLNIMGSFVGLEYLKVIHLNGSLNIIGSKKDRHANIFDTEKGENKIGAENMKTIFNHPKLSDKIFILETPEVPGKGFIFEDEIKFLRN